MINTTKIATSNLKQNKSKSILIIVTILLATTLLSAVGMTCVDWSFQNKQRVIKYSGTQHGAYARITDKKLEELKAHAYIDEVGLVNGIGMKEYEDETKIGIAYVDENASKFNNYELIDGKAPSKDNEIMLDDLALEKLGYEKKLGQKIVFEYSDFSKKEPVTTEFILCGITKANEMSKVKKIYSGITSREYMVSTRDMSKEDYNAFISIKDADKLSGEELIAKIKKIGEDLDIPKARVMVNEDYINTLKPDAEVMTWGVVISVVIILSSILVIYNIFYLSIVTKVQEFGKLRAIGATKKQIKAIVLKEGIILSLIAIPLGVLVGYVINEFVLGNIGFNNADISKLPIAIGVGIASFVTVLVSLLKPMKVASRVSIVDAVRYNGEENSKKKIRKGYESINLKRLSYANLKRNKKRTYITILSLSLSGIIFIVVSCLMSSMDAETMARNHMPYDIRISLDGYTYGEEDSPNTEMNMLQMKNPLGEEFVNQLLSMDGVTKVEKSHDVKSELKNYETEYKYHNLRGVQESDLEDLNLYLEEGTIDLEKLKNEDEIILAYPEMAKEHNIKVGDKITLILYDGDKKVEKEFKIQAISNGMGTFLIHEESFDKMFDNDTTNSLGVYIDKNKYENIKDYIETLDNSNDYIEASYLDDEIKSYVLSIGVTKAIGYSLVVVIGIIGFMNLINSMITSIITRKKELGMLQAIGLTDKQLVKMLNIEAMFYTSIMLISSLTLGNVLGYIAVQAFRKSGGSYAVYTLPITQILIMTVCVVVAQLLLTYLISKNFNKESLIDRVRYSE